jgi:hypothetical protein
MFKVKIALVIRLNGDLLPINALIINYAENSLKKRTGKQSAYEKVSF